MFYCFLVPGMVKESKDCLKELSPQYGILAESLGARLVRLSSLS